jgi:ferredoxin
MSEDVYNELRKFLDTFPGGFPETPTGVEIKILKKLFDPEQAEITLKLKNDPEDVSTIASRIEMEESEAAQKLEEMAQKGLIFRIREAEKPLYQAFQFLIGIYEFQLKDLDKEFCELFEEYMPYIGMSRKGIKTSQRRVIPVRTAIETASSVAPYNKVRDLVMDQETIAVAECICRKEQGLLGNECDKPKETCIMFGDFANYYTDNNMARAISKDETLKLLDQAEESGLVLRPTNTQDLSAICCCCSCCCPGLRFPKKTDRPADSVYSYYHAEINGDLCTACGECIDKCPMEAIKEGDDVSEMIDGRCIGCGLCVSNCPVEAISLVENSDMETPPKDFQETLKKIEIERRGIAM